MSYNGPVVKNEKLIVNQLNQNYETSNNKITADNRVST